MPEYKLIYGNGKGLAEPIRWLFALAKVDYEDYRIPYTPGTPIAIPQEIKEKLPYGQIPILEVDGQILSQSATICRFLARRFNLMGANEMEAARVDEVNDGLRDYFDAWKPVWQAKDEEGKAAAIKSAVEGPTLKYLPIFSRILEKNGNFLVGNSVTLADVNLVHFLSVVESVYSVSLLKGYPLLEAHRRRVEAIPEIAEWIEKRPKTAG